MKIKVFSFRQSYWTHWRLLAEQIEPTVNAWLAQHPRAAVHTIRHDVSQGIWYPPQLVISVYYTESDR